ncbi:carnitine transporter [Batrachochytrium dendrobatidis]|nr:carnitine transporter [Batrachochytrium dendrobatidis]KAK5665750.1 carnitine transporter [Batrachochytrium dendrobatidis]
MNSEKSKPAKSALKSFLSGACGGLTLVSVAHPFDLIKVRMQTAGPNSPSMSTFQAVKKIVAADGLLGLYRGVTPVLLGTPPVLATNFWAYFLCQQIVFDLTGGGHRYSQLDKQATNSDSIVNQLSLNQIGMAGALAAIPTSILLGPAEQLKIRLQIQKTSMRSGSVKRQGVTSIMRDIIREGGVKAIFRGTGFTILRDTPGSYFYFLVYEGLKRCFKRDDSDYVHPAAVMLCGGAAGMVNWIIAIPVDTVKSRLQSAAACDASVKKIVGKLLAESGPAGFFKGLGPTLLRAFPASAAFFFGVETSSQFMDRYF